MKKFLFLFMATLSVYLGFAQQVSDADNNAARQLVSANRKALGLSADDLNKFLVSGSYVDQSTGIRYAYLVQTYLDMPVYNQMQVLAFRDGKLLSQAGGRIDLVEQRVSSKSGSPMLSAESAVAAALADRKISAAKLPVVVSRQDNGRKIEFDKMGVSYENVTAQLMWVPDENGKTINLAWQIFVAPVSTSDYWAIRIDALNGRVLGVNNFTVHDQWGSGQTGKTGMDNTIPGLLKRTEVYNPWEALFDFKRVTDINKDGSAGSFLVNSATYRVIPFPAESPIAPGGAHALRTDPWLAAPGNASTLKWHTGTAGTDYDYTRGNNVWAYQDRVAPANTGTVAKSVTSTTSPDPLTFDFTPDFAVDPLQTTPVPNVQFNVTNLFYWNNIIHDLMYQYGFTEAAANFQDDNMGRGGTGNDHVNAEAQDNSGINNANFLTLADGSPGRMQMYLWNMNGASPQLDGDVDNGVIVHEYGHGISNRLTGGGTANCLSNAEQMGEGWSDYYALMFTQDWTTANLNTGFTSPRGIGVYALNGGNLFPTSSPGTGIRHYKYSTDMTVNPLVYLASLPTSPHDRGEIWCATLWDMTWNIINQEGTINPNLYNVAGGGGNTIAMKLVTEGMKLQPCNPGFISGRDAIIQADINLYGGAHVCAIREAFRRRGMGANASQGLSTSVTDQVPNYQVSNAVITLLQNNVISTPEGQYIYYKNRVVTDGCGNLVNYKITDTLPLNVSFVSATNGGTYNAGNRTVTWIINQASSTTVDYDFVVNINAGAYFPTVNLLNEEVQGPPPALPAGWSTTAAPTANLWVTTAAQSHSAPNSLFTSNLATVNDQILATSISFATPASPPELSFWHWYNSETGSGTTGFDGGVVEISTDGGTTWADIGVANYILNGYNKTISTSFSSPIAGRQAFSGNSNGFIESRVSLTPYANQADVRLRWRFASDNSVSAVGWYVDDIMIRNIARVDMRSNLFNAANERLSFSDSVMIITAPVCTPPVITAPTVTQPTCATLTGTIVVNATGVGTLEYSVDNGATYQASATFSTLVPGNHNIKVRLQANPSCEVAYTGNPVELTAAICCITNPVVTNNANSGPGSLRQAVIDACPGSTITFANSVISPISLSSGLIRIDKNITIQGPGTALTVQNTAAKGFASRVFHVVLGASVNISGLTISGANTYGSGGGIYTEGVLNLVNVTVSNNLSDSSGAGIYNLGTLTVTNSTISNNLANSNGFTGIGAEGGGIYTASFFGGSLTVINTTISNNYGNLGGGIYGPNSTINSRNSIIAGNTVRFFSSGPDFIGTVTSQGYNLVGKKDNSSGWVATDLTGTIATPLNPQLGPLADNGGPTQTLALLTGSPAINAGSNALAADPANNPLVFDQRGTGYPRIVGSSVDIGAFEVQCIPPTITAPTVTQPTCLVPTGTIVVNATGNSAMEYSVDNGANWQPSATFSGLVPSNYYIISARYISNTACASSYAGNPVVIHAPVIPVVGMTADGMTADGPLTFCSGGSVTLSGVVEYPNYLRMTAPYAIDFSIGTATFGADISTTPLNGNMVYIPDATASYLGCNPYTAGSLTGKVAVIDRGTCFFVYKAKNAQDAGAIGVIIVNNSPGDPLNMASGDPSVIVTIPVISVTQQDGALLKNMIAQGTTNGNTLPHTYSYLWSNGATTQSINVTQSGTFTVQVTDENGCSATTPPETVTVNPVPDAVATPSAQSICTGSTIATIVNSGAVSGTVFDWTRDNTADVTGIAASGTGDISGALVNTTNAAITVTFTITPSYTNEGVTCTGTAVTATVLVAPKPVLRETYNGVQVTANNDGTDDVGSFAVCSSTSDNVFLTEITDITNITPGASVKVEQVIIKTNVTINTAADGVYILTSVGPIPLGRTATLINPLVSGSVQIKRRAFYDANNNNSIDANECVGDWVVYNITVNPIPVAVATPAAQSTCTGSAITTIVNSSGVAGTTFNWSRDNTATVTGIAANGTGNISGTLTNTTAAPVTVTFTITPSANGCSGDAITATVTVNPAQYFACPGNMTETITDLNIPCFKAVNTPNPVFCGTLTKLTWKLTGATVLNSPTSGINYLGLRNMNVGTTTVTYTATFTGGTVKTCSFTVLVIETVPPNIYCPADVHVNTDAGKCYRTGPVSLGTPSVNDNCGIASVTNNAPAVYQKGVNFVTWTVTDKSGNSRSCVQKVTVNDVEKPVITCPANVIANTGPVCSATPVTLPTPVFTDNCAVVTLTWTMTGVTYGGSPLTGINYVPTMNYATGVSTITYTAIDESGNAKTCTFTVTLKDVTPPTLVCPPAQTFCKVPNNTYTVPVLIQSDNCVILSTTYKITGATSRTGTGTNASGIFNLGVSTITWTVKDVNGNTSTCTTTVTVVATTSPICVAPPVTNPVSNPKSAEVTAAVLSITAWPNPSSSYFNLRVNSPAKEILEIRMIDMAGKLVQVQRGAPGDTYQFGNNVVSGVYIIEVNQAGKTLRTKVVKQ